MPSSPPRNRGVSTRNRPLWMLIPGGTLMTLVIVVPLILAVWIALIDLDQYTLRRWIEAPFIGVANFTEAFRSGLLRSVWLSVSFALISTLATVPLGITAALVTQNPYRGRSVVRAIFLIPYVLPSFVFASRQSIGDIRQSAPNTTAYWPEPVPGYVQ